MVRSLRDAPRRREAGFTLIELMIVIGVMFILAGIALPRYKRTVLHARQAACKEDLYRLRQAIGQYHADKGRYPETLDTLKDEGYIHKVEKDPMNGEDWVEVPAEEDDTDNPTGAAGIWDVESATACGRSEDAEEE